MKAPFFLFSGIFILLLAPFSAFATPANLDDLIKFLPVGSYSGNDDHTGGACQVQVSFDENGTYLVAVNPPFSKRGEVKSSFEVLKNDPLVCDFSNPYYQCHIGFGKPSPLIVQLQMEQKANGSLEVLTDVSAKDGSSFSKANCNIRLN